VRRAIGIVFALAVALVFLNDAGRWVNAQSRLNESTAELAQWTATNVRNDSPAAGSAIVTAEGARRGVRVYQYDSDQTTLEVWSSADVPGTWVVGPYLAVMKGTPVDKAFGATFAVKAYQQAQFQ
jgi:hypothetical protein